MSYEPDTCPAIAGVEVTNRLEMHKWALDHRLPEGMQLALPGQPAPSGSPLGQLTVPAGLGQLSVPLGTTAATLWSIPLPPEDYPETDAICLTGHTQLMWLLQLLQSNVNFVLHVDGKHKLHHGGWMMVSIGTHDLRLFAERGTITHSYRPIVYMFVKQQETRQSARMLGDAVNYLAVKHFGEPLKPALIIMDHSSGLRAGMLDVWAEAGTCMHEACITYHVSGRYQASITYQAGIRQVSGKYQASITYQVGITYHVSGKYHVSHITYQAGIRQVSRIRQVSGRWQASIRQVSRIRQVSVKYHVSGRYR